MSDLEAVVQHIEHWIMSSLSHPREHFSGLAPCPYSKQAWLNNRVTVQCIDYVDLETALMNLAPEWSEAIDLAIFAVLQLSPAIDLDDQVKQLSHHLVPYDLVALVDQPGNASTTVSHFSTSNHKYPLVLVQKLSALQLAAEKLAGQGYYKNWSETDWNNIVGWRKDLMMPGE